jgi:exodeoxyribonuclease V alpha subunit
MPLKMQSRVMTTTHDVMRRLLKKGIFSEMDYHFGRFIFEVDDSNATELFLGAAMTSSVTRQGHICLDLHAVAENRLLEKENGTPAVYCPELKTWIEKLSESDAVGAPGTFKPLILDDHGRLYLYRYWQYQRCLVAHIKDRIALPKEALDVAIFKNGLSRLFAPTGQDDMEKSSEEIDWQQLSAFMALSKRFCLISGGPGTGKTTVVAKILALILEQPDFKNTRIALVAPTGKAAARLQEAIRKAKRTLECSKDVKSALPEAASTIHRLLGVVPGSPYFRHHGDHPLPVDVLVVDEASMVDLALMSKLIEALPSRSRLILLGDKDQLASVEAGAVLGDLCSAADIDKYSPTFCREAREVTGISMHAAHVGEEKQGIQDGILQLQRNYRFLESSGIATLSRLVKEGRVDGAYSFLVANETKDVSWKPLPMPEAFLNAVHEPVLKGFADYLKAAAIDDALFLFDRFRVLCALRDGPYGVRGLNATVEKILRGAGLINPTTPWYRGRPVMITQNDYHLQLFNGDIGILWPDSEAENAVRAFFPGPENTPRRFHPLRLPKHETVFAMTVHKSQGSEFDHVMFFMPEKPYPVLTRELVYTGITRAKKYAELWGTEASFRFAVENRTTRMSGLSDLMASE